MGVLVAVAIAFWAGRDFREARGIELSADSLRAYVQGIGLLAPAAFVGLVTLRQVLLLPSAVVLTVGGLLFGAITGGLLGGAGLVCSALLCFGAARVLGREWLWPRLPEGLRDLERRAGSAVVWIVGVMTAHPMGVMTPVHLGAGATRMAWQSFAAVVALAAPLRAALYASFGASLLDIGSSRFYAACALLAVASLLPLAHPRARAVLLAYRGRRVPPAAGRPPSQ